MDGAVALPLAPGPIIDPDEAGRRRRVALESLDVAKERIRADRHGQSGSESGADLAAEGTADRFVGPAESGRGASMWLGEAREALGEGAARAVRLGAGEAADGDPEPDSPSEAGQIGEPMAVSTVDATGVGTADGTGGDRQVDGQVLDVVGAVIETAPRGS